MDSVRTALTMFLRPWNLFTRWGMKPLDGLRNVLGMSETVWDPGGASPRGTRQAAVDMRVRQGGYGQLR